MIPSDDPFFPLFKKAFDYNYGVGIHYEPIPNKPVLPPKSSPLTFYDRHLASNLILKQMIHIPSMVDILSKMCDDSMEKYLANGGKFYPEGLHASREAATHNFQNAHAVSDYYVRYVGQLSHKFASKILLHPNCRSWASLFYMEETLNYESNAFLTEAWLRIRGNPAAGSLRFHQDIAPEVELQGCLDQATTEKIIDIGRRHPQLATWEMFAMTEVAIALCQKRLASTSDFAWERCGTTGFQTTSHSPFPPDTIEFVSQFVPSLKSTRSKALKKPTASDTKSKSVKISRVVRPPKPVGTASRGRRQYRPEIRSYIQHAWAKAVVNDSTFIILHCGRYERIGIRHRETQTLYLSGLIDPINTQDPRYRKLQIALHIAIVQDVLERHEITAASGSRAKRSAEEINDETDAAPPKKRRKGSSKNDTTRPVMNARRLNLEITEAISTRMIALVNLQYGAYCSPTPASFIRLSSSCAPSVQSELPPLEDLKSGYKASEYFTLTMDSPRGEGATGVVHPASLEVQVLNPSGNISVLKRNDLIVKLAFAKEQQDRLRHESKVYDHLARHRVKGIPTVHGLFLDRDSGALGLLMDNVGQSLIERELERSGEREAEQVTTTKAERRAFLAAMKNIHNAGVRHMDIRAENLLVNPATGVVVIIDFDRAQLAHENLHIAPNYNIEMLCLKRLLEGRYRQVNYD
ncbi:hypothetical protein M413DRAFT_391409 [Hebeloma cylindrosporum]|uniref:Protein kinase domain-containing protein n=1 Tax=Hebeloma cylindrosporum TaxID=76867 RepID=A0A0C3BDC2_HEBCY|nr:hypothetical protein M413DRAFT_391409 [Hebeloma cylindrosporum h7]